MSGSELPIHGRGTPANPANRFTNLAYVPDPDADPTETPSPATQFFKDTTRSIIARNDSPDVGFSASINPYRGCEHGCVYCYARPYHEYLGLSAGLDFETKIFVKEDAPELLREALSSPRWQPEVLGISGVTDPYQPIERRLQLTRRCLEVLADFRNPVSIITKNHLVTRDVDYLGELARHEAAIVFLSITTLDVSLRQFMEPRTTSPAGRLEAVAELARAGVSVGVMVAPIIPGLNDHEIPTILKESAQAGARFAGYTTLRLPYAVAGLFEQWLDQHFPDKKERVLSRVRALRGGKLNESRFGIRMKGEGVYAAMIKEVFSLSCKRHGLNRMRPTTSTAAFRRLGSQPMLFE
jgi:DNA repair photolyase